MRCVKNQAGGAICLRCVGLMSGDVECRNRQRKAIR